jgi:hypothetical protein
MKESIRVTVKSVVYTALESTRYFRFTHHVSFFMYQIVKFSR